MSCCRPGGQGSPRSALLSLRTHTLSHTTPPPIRADPRERVCAVGGAGCPPTNQPCNTTRHTDTGSSPRTAAEARPHATSRRVPCKVSCLLTRIHVPVRLSYFRLSWPSYLLIPVAKTLPSNEHKKRERERKSKHGAAGTSKADLSFEALLKSLEQCVSPRHA
jgi:hypothetical protein